MFCKSGKPCLPIREPSTHFVEESLAGEGPFPASRMVQQLQFKFNRKHMAILEPSAQPWGQQRTTLTKELTRKLLNCRKKLGCEVKQKHLSRYMQLVANSGYNVCFRMEVLKSGLVGYNRILAADSAGTRPIYRMKQWQASSRWMEKKRRKKN